MQRYQRVTECKVQKNALNHILIALRSSALSLLSDAMQKVLALHSMNGSFYLISSTDSLLRCFCFVCCCSTRATLLRSKLRCVDFCSNQNTQNN